MSTDLLREGGEAVVEGCVEFHVPDGELDGVRDLRDEMLAGLCDAEGGGDAIVALVGQLLAEDVQHASVSV